MSDKPTQYKNWREWWDMSPEANPIPLIPSYEAVSQVTWIAAQRARDLEVKALREALEDATKSLETIANRAGKRDELLEHIQQIRGYANSRAISARTALGVKG